MKPRSFSLRTASVLVAAGVVVLAFRSHDARAGWPPAPGANMQDQSNWPNDYNAQWNYTSWLPTQAAGTPPLLSADATLGAAGMSVDIAWTYTIGRDDIHIAICDSGIEWEQPDLVNKVLLNAKELSNHKPQNAQGGVCGGTGALAGFDCNGDGIFNIADYRDDPRIAPTVTGDKCYTDFEHQSPGGDRIMGDINRNCILDPGDLIELFTDNVDDDANGYTDDIAGWDFLKNDNNPYDDTRYGHGTGEAKDSSAEGNNGIDSLGVCPLCRFTPLRVGDSFIADSNDFAKAVTYASDNGYKIIQEALGTIDQTAFSKAAIDYAYKNGLIVVASMADENSRHHNMPGDTNHTLTVHTVRYDGTDPTTSTSFLYFDTCTNYGGQLSMSISGTSCSSEATGRASGLSGLLFSYAESQNVTLTPEEAIQLFKMNADDINVAESRETSDTTTGRFYWSQPGWDQRFGYGRANAAHMMAAVQAGMIPPEVDITAPEWFTPVFADRTNQVAVVGRVAAARAPSYDYQVQWAPGVQPLDTDFKALAAPLTNVPGTTVSGGPDTPLATFDPSQIDTTHTRDPDSPNGENDRTITIRVQATAHYASGDIHGEARRTISITNQKNGLDGDLVAGFPLAVGASVEGGAKLVDVDGDGVRDIVVPVTDGTLHVFTMKSGQPQEVSGFPYKTQVIDGLNPTLNQPTVPSYLSAPAYSKGAQGGIDPTQLREALVDSPAVADLDGDNKPEIIFGSWPGTIYVIDSKGQDLPGWPKRLPLVPSCPQDPTKTAPNPCMDVNHGVLRGGNGSPVVKDMDGDGKPEIVFAAFDGNIYVFKIDGTALPGFPVFVHDTKATKTNRIMTTPTVADFNGDGVPDIATGSNEETGGGGNSGPIFIVDGRGTNAPQPYLPDWPISIVSLHLFPVVGEGIDSSQATADFDGDGKPDLLMQGNGAPPYVLQSDPGAQVGLADPPNRLPVTTDQDGNPQIGFQPTAIFGDYTKAFRPDTMFPLFSHPSIGDVDQDGVPDVIMSGGSLSLAGNLAGGSSAKPFQHLLAMWSGKTGAMMPGAPVVVEDYTFLTNQAIADLSGDNYPEVIVGTGGYFVHAADACGNEPEGWPKFTNGWIAASPAIGDIDGDHSLEVIEATRDGYIFAWHTRGRDDGVIAWESFHHDNANTGDYSTKLDQGSLKLASTPIDCTPPVAPGSSTYDLGGGCSCDAAGADSRGARAPAFLFALTLGGALFVRRRRRRVLLGQA